MAFRKLDLAWETSASSGTGALTLAGAYSNKFRTFAAAGMTDGDTCVVRIEHVTAGVAEWEVCYATWNTGGTLTRGTLISSSTGSRVSFSTGGLYVYSPLLAQHALSMDDNGDAAVTRDFAIGRNATVAGTLGVTGAFSGSTGAFSGVLTVPTAAPGTSTTQAASCAFVAAAVALAVTNVYSYRGTWDANANVTTPVSGSPGTLASGVGTAGDVWYVATAGTTTLDGISSWTVGDHAMFDGTTWKKVEGTLTLAEVLAALGYTPMNVAGDTMTGDLKFTDATYDIGKSGATRPRDGFFSRNLVVGGTYNGYTPADASALGDAVADSVTADAFKVTGDNVNAQTGTTYTLQASDNGKVVTLNNGSAITLTVPSGLAAGFSCTLVQLGAGQVTIAASSTTLRYPVGLKIADQYGQASVLYIAADTYSIGGHLEA
jgi:hypothetical protein